MVVPNTQDGILYKYTTVVSCEIYKGGIYLYRGGIMTEKTQVNLRLPDNVIAELKAEAQKQKRSLNNLLEFIIDEYLKKVESDD